MYKSQYVDLLGNEKKRLAYEFVSQNGDITTNQFLIWFAMNFCKLTYHFYIIGSYF